ncbi:MAG: hypothetical protein FWC33_05570 [Candidatus Bathyarchaeota archaeon]|nr:hypothetical protein [Candidatus Termiticorpusculum sp.]
MLFKDFLQALRDRGDHAVAEEISTAVTAKFKGVLTFQELQNKDMNEINGVLNLAKTLTIQVHCSSLDTYVQNLQAQGFSVTVNPEYLEPGKA